VTDGPTLSGNNIGPPGNVGPLSRPWQLRGVSTVWPAGVILFNWLRYGGVALFPLASRLQHCMDDWQLEITVVTPRDFQLYVYMPIGSAS